MDFKNFLKIIPSELRLTENQPIKCSVSECESKFQNLSNLQFHLKKHHRINITKSLNINAIVRYYCPVNKCKYNVNQNVNDKYFKSKKYLKQHFLKVHATKTIKCSKCDKMFACETLKQQHERTCGIQFVCTDCAWSYASRECLLTHCRRKGHTIPENENTLRVKNISKQKFPNSQRTFSETKDRKIAPIVRSTIEENSNKHNCFAIKRIKDILDGSPAAKIKANFDRLLKNKIKERKISQMTQTASLYNVNCMKLSKTVACNATIKSKSIAIGTTTDTTTQKYHDFDLIDEESNILINDPSQAYKNLNNLNYLEDDTSLNHFTVSNFNSGLCHIETQTELMAFGGSVSNSNNDMDPLLCHMHTQTSDEILTELGFTDIQTQTNWPNVDYNDLFVSTETQTCLPHSILDNISIQTQTAITIEMPIKQ